MCNKCKQEKTTKSYKIQVILDNNEYVDIDIKDIDVKKCETYFSATGFNLIQDVLFITTDTVFDINEVKYLIIDENYIVNYNIQFNKDYLIITY